MGDENDSLKKQLKESQEKLSKYELNKPQPIQTHVVQIESPSLEREKDGLIDKEKYEEKVKEEERQKADAMNLNTTPVRERPKPPKKEEKDPFWIDVKDKMQNTDYQTVKKCLPNKDFIDEEDERWKMNLWTTDYGEYKLQCTVFLVNYNTDDWTE